MQHIVDHSSHNIFNGDFNVIWLVEAERESLYNVMVRDNGYRKLADNPTTDKQLINVLVLVSEIQKSAQWRIDRVCGMYSSLWLKLLCPSAFWYVCTVSSNTCLSDDSVEMRLLIDAGSCLKMLGRQAGVHATCNTATTQEQTTQHHLV